MLWLACVVTDVMVLDPSFSPHGEWIRIPSTDGIVGFERRMPIPKTSPIERSKVTREWKKSYLLY